MSPEKQASSGKVRIKSNAYTTILAFAFCVVLASAVFVALRCYGQYGKIF
jgi:hypothetical protein